MGCCLRGTFYSSDENKNVSLAERDSVNLEITYAYGKFSAFYQQSLSMVFRYFDAIELS